MDHLDRIVSRRPGVRWRQSVRGVLLHTGAMDDPVLVTSPGDAVWAELERPCSVEGLVAAMADRFAGDRVLIRADIETLLASLETLGVIDVAG
jgi:hypothetical protein